MTPNEVEFLIHCHTIPNVHPRMDAPAVQRARDFMVEQDLIFKMGGQKYYATTSRGKAHVQQICDLSLPNQAWVGSDGELINERR